MMKTLMMTRPVKKNSIRAACIYVKIRLLSTKNHFGCELNMITLFLVAMQGLEQRWDDVFLVPEKAFLHVAIEYENIKNNKK